MCRLEVCLKNFDSRREKLYATMELRIDVILNSNLLNELINYAYTMLSYENLHRNRKLVHE